MHIQVTEIKNKPSLVRPILTYCSPWPYLITDINSYLITDINSLGRVQWRATKYVLNDFISD